MKRRLMAFLLVFSMAAGLTACKSAGKNEETEVAEAEEGQEERVGEGQEEKEGKEREEGEEQGKGLKCVE